MRYGFDKTKNTRLTTVELVVDEYPNLDSGTITMPTGVEQARYLAIKVAFNEPAVRKKIRHAGGYWDSKQRVWWLENKRVKVLRLADRVVEGCVWPDIVR